MCFNISNGYCFLGFFYQFTCRDKRDWTKKNDPGTGFYPYTLTGARYIWRWVRSERELLRSDCSVQHVHQVFFTAFLSFFCSQSKPQGAGSLWDQIDVHVQCGSQRRSDWMDSIKVGKRGRGRVFTDQSHRVLCQTFLQRHGELIFYLLSNLVQHKIVFIYF